MFAQIGLGVDPTGGIVILLVIGLLAILGLVSCIVGVILIFRYKASRHKSLLILVLGLVLASPALWLAYVLFEEDIPRDKSWDFSSTHGVAQLQEQKDADSYYYQGNIRSTVRLPADRHWSGNAYLVVFRAKSGQIADIHWQSRRAPAPLVYEQAKRILKGLALPDRDLDSWYAKVRGGEQASFAVANSDANGSIEVQVRGSTAENDWVVHVNVSWK